MFECMCFPYEMCGCEAWMINAQAKKRLNVFEMDGQSAICDLRRIDKIRYERIREMCGSRKVIVNRGEKDVLRWFRHVRRMNE